MSEIFHDNGNDVDDDLDDLVDSDVDSAGQPDTLDGTMTPSN